MKWVIKNPAPSDSRRTKWGDYHFGRSLSSHLERRGHQVVTHYDPGWGVDERADVVLVLRGKYPCPPGQGHAGALRIMWNISHPADVSLEEYDTYDLVGVASRWWASELADQVAVPVVPLLQCTDPEAFHPGAGDGRAPRDVVFVGNTRDVFRPGVVWALEYGLPLRIWGRGWDSLGVPDRHVVADYIANEELGGLYASSRATINDHWEDMKRFGYVNNRLLDALACGLPVVSDWHPSAEEVIPGGVLWYRDQFEFEQCMQSLLLEHPRIKREAEAAGEQVRTRHTFAHRAEELCRLVEDLRA